MKVAWLAMAVMEVVRNDEYTFKVIKIFFSLMV